MNCIKCGNELKENDNFCNKCGNVVKRDENTIDDPINESVATIFYVIAFVIGVFSSGIVGLLKFGVDIIAYTPLWLPPIFFVIGLALVIYSKIKYHTKHSTLILILYIIFGIINMAIYYLLIGSLYTILRAIFEI